MPTEAGGHSVTKYRMAVGVPIDAEFGWRIECLVMAVARRDRKHQRFTRSYRLSVARSRVAAEEVFPLTTPNETPPQSPNPSAKDCFPSLSNCSGCCCSASSIPEVNETPLPTAIVLSTSGCGKRDIFGAGARKELVLPNNRRQSARALAS